jgi:cysteine desulfurase
VDATQAVGKLPVDVKASGVDLMTLAGHKLHGPKGIGALYVRQGVRLRPINRGGPQERERRGGTENTPAIIGLGVAAELTETFLSRSERAEAGEEVPGATVQSLRALRDKLEAGILQAVPQAKVNGLDPSPPRDKARLWNTTNIGFPALEAEALLLGMSQKGLCASAGAACSSGSLEPSPVLLAMGVPESIAHGSIRLSLGRFTTAEEIDRALEIVPEVVQRLGRSLAWAVP